MYFDAIIDLNFENKKVSITDLKPSQKMYFSDLTVK